jgi:hypothetical protein
MRFWRAILWTVALLACTAPALAQETDENEPLSTAKLTVEEAGRLLATGRAAYEDGLFRLARRRLEELVAGAPDKRRQAKARCGWRGWNWRGTARDARPRWKRTAAGCARRRWRRLCPGPAPGAFALGQLPEAAAELD